MKYIKKLILIPFVSPLLLLLLISTLNNTKPVSFQLLTWKTPTIKIGLWLALAGSTSAVLTSISVLAITQNNHKLTRKVIVKPSNSTNIPESSIENQNELEINEYSSNYTPQPERRLREPPPTIAVPFRIIKHIDRDEFLDEDSYTEQISEDEFLTDETELNNDTYYNQTFSESNNKQRANPYEDWSSNINDDW